MCYQRGVADSDLSSVPSAPAPSVPIGEVIDLVKSYARQETMAPMRGAGRWAAWGTAGAILLGTGTMLLVLGLLRLLQNELAPTFSGRWMSLLPYVAALVLCFVVIGVAISRIAKSSLNKD